MKTLTRFVTLVLALIAFASGGAAIVSGLPDAAPVLDNAYRFYAGIWVALGFGLLHAALFFERSARIFPFLMRALIVGAVARAVGLFHYAPERAVLAPIIVELVVPVVLLWMQSRIRRKQTQAIPLRNGKSVLVTGANGGLGMATVKCLVQDGFSRIVMACRSQEKAEEAQRTLIAELGGDVADVLVPVGGFDMTAPAAIEEAVLSLTDNRFDVVFLQAGGVVFDDDYQAVSWKGRAIERTVFQNVVGADFVLQALLRLGLLAPRARVVFAGGEGARGIKGMIAKPEFADSAALRDYIYGDSERPAYNPLNAIGVSKLVGALWLAKLAELAPCGLEAIWFSPGLTYGTQGLKNAPTARRFFMERVAFPVAAVLGLAQSPEDGARKYADCLRGSVGQNGDIIGAPEGGALGILTDQKPMNAAFTDPGLREEVWGILAELREPKAGRPRVNAA